MLLRKLSELHTAFSFSVYTYTSFYIHSSYFSGHDHDLQYIKEDDSSVNYFVSGAGHLIEDSDKHKASLTYKQSQVIHAMYLYFSFLAGWYSKWLTKIPVCSSSSPHVPWGFQFSHHHWQLNEYNLLQSFRYKAI